MTDNIAEAIETERVIAITRAVCEAGRNDDDEEQRARVIAQLLDQPGIEVEIDWVLPKRPNVIARVRGSGQGPGLLLNGHLDAAFHPGTWRHDPFDAWIEGTRIFGGAITDMLGGVASMVAALEAASRLEALPGDLVFLGSMHHDTIGLGAKYALSSRNGWPRYGICGEPSSLGIQSANGGAVKYEVRFEGRVAHISRYDEGVDSLAAAVEVAQALRSMPFTRVADPRLPDLPIALVGEIQAGSAPGLVAGSSLIRGDVRISSTMDRESVRADLERAIASACPPGVRWTLDLIAVQRPFLGAEEGPLVDAVSAAHVAVRGSSPETKTRLPGEAFVTDAADMAAAGVESVVYGPCDWHYAPDEWVEIDELVDAARIYLLTATRLV